MSGVKKQGSEYEKKVIINHAGSFFPSQAEHSCLFYRKLCRITKKKIMLFYEKCISLVNSILKKL